jgi:hypothetical protein
MEWERYSLVKNIADFSYEFYSEGANGKIKKIIKFQPVVKLGNSVFNLAFGDFNAITGGLNDVAVSNNGDGFKILYTVAEAIVDFTMVRPDAIILIEGSTSSRIRLYQMRIASFWSEISQQFEIFGELDREWLPFKKGVNYKRFLLFKKNR